MTFTFNATKHEYQLDGKPVTGVTSVLGVLAKPALIGWAAKMACEYVWDNKEKLTEDYDDGAFAYNCLDDDKLKAVLEEAKNAHRKKKEAAGEHGTNAHALVEEWINITLPSSDTMRGRPQHEKFEPIYPFIDWALENVDHFLFSERRMVSEKLWLAGTCDFAYIGKDGRRYIADFKTSSGIYGIDYWLQVAAYRMLAESEGDSPYDGATIVRLGKKGPSDFEVQQLFDYETFKEAFLACLTIYRAQAAIKGLTVQ